MSDGALYIAKKCCGQCLTTPRRIVTEQRASEIIAECKDENKHFFCHKGDLIGKKVHCRGVHELNGPSMAYRFAQAFGIPILEVDMDGE